MTNFKAREGYFDIEHNSDRCLPNSEISLEKTYLISSGNRIIKVLSQDDSLFWKKKILGAYIQVSLTGCLSCWCDWIGKIDCVNQILFKILLTNEDLDMFCFPLKFDLANY